MPTPEQVAAGAQADYDHDPVRMVCMDHDRACCPIGDAHDMGHRARRDHRVAAVLAAVLPDAIERARADALAEAAAIVNPLACKCRAQACGRAAVNEAIDRLRALR